MGKKDEKKVKSRNLPNTFESDGSFRIVCSSSIIKGFPGSVEEDLFSGNYRCRKWQLLFLVHWVGKGGWGGAVTVCLSLV